MKVATWNVNSIRARCEAVMRWLQKQSPDVLCVQETKVSDEAFPAEPFREIGYDAVFSGQKSYNGVAILSRLPIRDVYRGFPAFPDDPQKRLITARIDGIWIVNVYLPNGESVGSQKFAYKLDFFKRLRAYLADNHDPDEPLLLAGDLNVAPEDRDVYDPDEWQGEILCHPEERAALADLKLWGLSDLFRRHHPEGGHYSWWDYRTGAFRRDRGLRIDHLMGSPSLVARSVSCEIDKESRAIEKPSDHAAVMVTFDRAMAEVLPEIP